MRRIKLTKYEPTQVMFNNYGAYRLRIDASDAEGEGLDENIFIYKRNVNSPYNADNVDVFEGIVGPPQLSSLPIGEPDPDQNWPYYRHNTITLDFGSTAEAIAVWNEIKEDVNVLLQALDRLDSLQPTEELWIPSPPDNSESASL